jgi:DNA primase
MSDAVQQIKDQLSIIDVIAPYVELKKAGKNYKGKSPFSSERTPSFYVSPERGMYYCFSTNQGGDMFNFVQAMEGVDFKGALTQLAEKAGVELVREDPKTRNEREQIYAALADAAAYYATQLQATCDATGYLERRGVHARTIEAWQIGYAPGPPARGWRELRSVLNKSGYADTDLVRAGLIKYPQTEGAQKKEPFDVFRDRIVFPMSDPSGRVVAFSGRILSADSDAPKYVNSPETSLYKKSELLFGYDKAKNHIRTLGFTLVVEGQFDVVMCHQAGYTNTVAVSGTAMTSHHVTLLERLSNRAVLALDRDRAGIAAMRKAAELMLARGMDVKVARFPDGQDPADVIAADLSLFKKTIKNAVTVIEFFLAETLASHADPRARKRAVRAELLPLVALIPDHIEQEHFVGVIAEGIDASRDAIRHELERVRVPDTADSAHISRSLVPQSESAVVSPDAPASDAPRRTKADLRARLYLEAIVELNPQGVGERLRLQLADLTQKNIESTESERAQVLFELETQLDSFKRSEVLETVVSRLNYVRSNELKTQLATLRRELTAVESGQVTGRTAADILKDMQAVAGALRAPAYTAADFA